MLAKHNINSVGLPSSSYYYGSTTLYAEFWQCQSTTKENQQLSSTYQGSFGIKNTGCIQHPL